MLFDSHMHTFFSADSEMRAEDALRAGETLGLGLVFTEHFDADFPGDLEFNFDPEEYFARFGALRGDRLLLGAEVGMRESSVGRTRAFSLSAPFDLVIGSLHLLDGIDLYEKECYAGREKEEIFRAYCVAIARELRAHSFVDVLGHIDYICRRAPYEDPELSYGEFSDCIDAVLRAAIETDTVLELNTRRLRDRRAVKELLPVYDRYRELGGEYITLGSDAHGAEAIGCNFKEAREMAEFLNLSPVTFRERRMERAAFD